MWTSEHLWGKVLTLHMVVACGVGVRVWTCEHRWGRFGIADGSCCGVLYYIGSKVNAFFFLMVVFMSVNTKGWKYSPCEKNNNTL